MKFLNLSINMAINLERDSRMLLTGEKINKMVNLQKNHKNNQFRRVITTVSKKAVTKSQNQRKLRKSHANKA